MALIGTILSWIFCILLGLLALSMALTGNLPRAFLLLAAILLLLPPVQALILSQTGRSIPVLVRLISVVVLVGIFAWITANDKQTSIYITPEAEARHMEIYDARLAAWPHPYESKFVDSQYGKVHVIISGPEEAPPALLMHAGAVSSWSWLYNVGELNEHYRTYAIDTIGEVGKSVLNDLEHFPKNGDELSHLYAEVADALGVEKAYIVGASNGGFIATYYAINYPERVEKMALLGPMGLTPATGENIIRITIAQLYPMKPLQDSTMRWAFGDSPQVLEAYEEWFRIVLSKTMSKQVPPSTIAAEKLRQVQSPVLLVLGTNDRLMGDLDKAKEHASNIPDIQIVEIESGHLIGVEQPEKANELILAFFE